MKKIQNAISELYWFKLRSKISKISYEKNVHKTNFFEENIFHRPMFYF